MRGRSPSIGLVFSLCLILTACGQRQLFPPEVMQGVDTNFDFASWREKPTAALGRDVQLGGRILLADAADGGVLIVGEQLPIVQHPVYGPSSARKRFGVFEFAILYKGKIDSSALNPGNRFIVVGKTQGSKVVSVEGLKKEEPLLIARCIHVWKTGGTEIADFSSEGAGYQPLEQNTYCAAGE